MQVSVRTAQAQLSKLIELARTGEEVVIVRNHIPVARILPIQANGFRIGILRDQLRGPVPDFFRPIDAETLALWEGG